MFSAMATSSQFTSPGNELIISPSAVHRARRLQRAELAAEIRDSFDPQVPLTLHWDGKLMSNYTNTGTEQLSVDRLPIMVSGKEMTKLLAIPKLNCSTAAVISELGTGGQNCCLMFRYNSK